MKPNYYKIVRSTPQSEFTLNCTAYRHPTELRPALVGISGFACSSYNFEWLVPYLTQHVDLYLIDNRGMGGSEAVQQPYNLEDLADDAAEAMKFLGVNSYHVAGISMGGMIAQLLTLRHPEKVESLSLLCTTSGGPDFLPLPPLPEDALRQFYAVPEPRRSELALKAYVHPLLQSMNPELFDKMVELRSSHPARLDQVLLQKKAVDTFLEKPLPLQNIRCRTLILAADGDRFVPFGNAARLQSAIPGSQVQVVRESDHFFFLEKAAEVGALLTSFLGSPTTTPQPSSTQWTSTKQEGASSHVTR